MEPSKINSFLPKIFLYDLFKDTMIFKSISVNKEVKQVANAFITSNINRNLFFFILCITTSAATSRI